MQLVEELHTYNACQTSADKLKLLNLMEWDDIEAYQTTFEWISLYMKWAYKLPPELTGKAQLTCAAMDTAASVD